MDKVFDIFAYLMGKAAGGGGGSGGDVTVESKSISSNGTYTAPSGKAYSPVTVSVPASAVDTGTKSITSNGANQDVVGYAAVDVSVPNSYAAGDEGKVVSNGELVAQTSDSVTQNGTVDTTLINSLTVKVSGGIGPTWTEVISTSACTNIKACINALLGGTTIGKNYVGAIFDKAVEDYAYNQLCYFIALNRTADTASLIPYLRYRNGGYNATQGNTTTYDAVIEVGDKFYICEV